MTAWILTTMPGIDYHGFEFSGCHSLSEYQGWYQKMEGQDWS